MEEKIEEKMINGRSTKEAWSTFRRVIYLLTFFTGAYILYPITMATEPTGTISTIATGLLTLTTWVLLGWMFGSVVDDQVNNELNGLPIAEAWAKRRRVIYLILFYSLSVFLYMTFFLKTEADLKIHKTILTGLFELNTWILMGWMFGSLMDSGWFQTKMKGMVNAKKIN